MDCSHRFEIPVVIEFGHAGLLQRVRSVRAAREALATGWPTGGRGRAYLAALTACHDALADQLDAEAVRQAFIAAAAEVGISVRDTPARS
jgi:Protein of unknown function (DUF982)